MKRVMLRAAVFASFVVACACAAAFNPLDHTSIMKDNDLLQSSTVEDDEEDPYLLLVGEADKAIADGDYIVAVMRLKDAIAINPDSPTNALLYSNLGNLYGQLGQDSLAMKSFDEALAIAPAMTSIRISRAKQHLNMGRDRLALKDFAVVLERDSLNSDARYYHGFLSLYDGDIDTAIKDFEVLQSVCPDDKDTHIALATTYSITGRDREAVEHLKKLCVMDPKSEYYAAMARSYLKLDDLSHASEAIAEGIDKFPDDAELYYYRAVLNKAAYRLDDAKRDADKSIELGGDPKKARQLFK